jgi:DNA polymerase/3'-5' exonuclease PolX
MRPLIESTNISVHPSISTIDSLPKVFRPFIQKLQSSGHIVDHLKITPTQYTAIAQIPNTDPPLSHRQITFHFVDWNAFVFAELHHTGSENFLLHLREQAAKLGLDLGANYLQKRRNIVKEVFGEKAMQFLEETIETREYQEGDQVFLSSEEDVFRFLSLKYVPPHERNW